MSQLPRKFLQNFDGIFAAELAKLELSRSKNFQQEHQIHNLATFLQHLLLILRLSSIPHHFLRGSRKPLISFVFLANLQQIWRRNRKWLNFRLLAWQGLGHLSKGLGRLGRDLRRFCDYFVKLRLELRRDLGWVDAGNVVLRLLRSVLADFLVVHGVEVSGWSDELSCILRWRFHFIWVVLIISHVLRIFLCC